MKESGDRYNVNIILETFCTASFVAVVKMWVDDEVKWTFWKISPKLKVFEKPPGVSNESLRKYITFAMGLSTNF